VLVVLAGLVRCYVSVLGCPDWPLSHVNLLPPFQLHVLIEYSHRTVTTLASLLVVAVALAAWLAVRDRPDLRLFATIAAGLLILQVGLGGITVLLDLPSAIVLAHLATALALLGVVCASAVAAWVPRARPSAIDRPAAHWSR